METSFREPWRPIGPIRKSASRLASAIARGMWRASGKPQSVACGAADRRGRRRSDRKSHVRDRRRARRRQSDRGFARLRPDRRGDLLSGVGRAARLRLLQRIAAVRRGFRRGQGLGVRRRSARGAERRRPGRDRAAGGGRLSADRDDVVRPFASRELCRHVAAAVRGPRARASPPGRARKCAWSPPGSAFREERA